MANIIPPSATTFPGYTLPSLLIGNLVEERSGERVGNIIKRSINDRIGEYSNHKIPTEDRL